MDEEREDKCSKCGTTKSKTFWDFDDGSVLCDKCHKEVGDTWKKRNYTPWWTWFFAIPFGLAGGIIGTLFAFSILVGYNYLWRYTKIPIWAKLIISFSPIIIILSIYVYLGIV